MNEQLASPQAEEEISLDVAQGDRPCSSGYLVIAEGASGFTILAAYPPSDSGNSDAVNHMESFADYCKEQEDTTVQDRNFNMCSVFRFDGHEIERDDWIYF